MKCPFILFLLYPAFEKTATNIAHHFRSGVFFETDYALQVLISAQDAKDLNSTPDVIRVRALQSFQSDAAQSGPCLRISGHHIHNLVSHSFEAARQLCPLSIFSVPLKVLSEEAAPKEPMSFLVGAQFTPFAATDRCWIFVSHSCKRFRSRSNLPKIDPPALIKQRLKLARVVE